MFFGLSFKRIPVAVWCGCVALLKAADMVLGNEHWLEGLMGGDGRPSTG